MNNATAYTKIPYDMISLVTMVTPRTIKSEQQHDEFVNMLLRVSRIDNMTSDQMDYSRILSDFIVKYEEETCELLGDKPTGLESLKFLIENNKYTVTYLAECINIPRTSLSRILSGKRNMDLNTIKKLSEFFKVKPELFF